VLKEENERERKNLQKGFRREHQVIQKSFIEKQQRKGEMEENNVDKFLCRWFVERHTHTPRERHLFFFAQQK